MKIEKLAKGQIVILYPKRSLIGGEETDELKDTLSKLASEGNKMAIIELSKVQYINSTGISALITGHKTYTQNNGNLKLSGLSDKLENVLVITKLNEVFEIHPNVKEALASFTVK
jgi:anti-sigma B factor antagonist